MPTDACRPDVFSQAGDGEREGEVGAGAGRGMGGHNPKRKRFSVEREGDINHCLLFGRPGRGRGDRV